MRKSQLAALVGLSFSTEGISDKLKDIWGDVYSSTTDIVNMKQTVRAENIPLSVEVIERINKAEAKLARKQLKRL